MSIGTQIGARVRHLRKARRMTAREVAERAAMLRRNVTRLETGRHMPTLDTIVSVAAALDVRPSEILSVLDEVQS